MVMKKSADNSGNKKEFPLEKRFEAPNYRLIKARIATIPSMETLRECIAYENAHRIGRDSCVGLNGMNRVIKRNNGLLQYIKQQMCLLIGVAG